MHVLLKVLGFLKVAVIWFVICSAALPIWELFFVKDTKGYLHQLPYTIGSSIKHNALYLLQFIQ